MLKLYFQKYFDCIYNVEELALTIQNIKNKELFTTNHSFSQSYILEAIKLLGHIGLLQLNEPEITLHSQVTLIVNQDLIQQSIQLFPNIKK